MEVKKTKKADLERKRTMFMQIGMVMALGATLVAFEWKTIRESPGLLSDNFGTVIEDEMIPIVRLKEPEPPKPKPKPIVLEQLIIVDDETDLPGDDLEIDSEDLDEYLVELSDVEEGEEDGDPIPFFSLVNKPEFPGGNDKLLSFLMKSVKYPVIAQENGIQGTVYLSFVISKTGKVEKVAVLRGVDSSLDKEAIRVVSSMPDWKPGKQGTRPVAVSYQVPIKFMLQ